MMAIHYNILNKKESMSQLRNSKKKKKVRGNGAREEGELLFIEECKVMNADGLIG